MKKTIREKILAKTSERPLEFAENMAAVVQILSAFESMNPSERRRGGINNWEHLKSSASGNERLNNLMSREGIVRVALGLRISGSVTLLAVRGNSARKYLALLITSCQILTSKYTLNGSDGADQLAGLIHASSALGRVGRGKNKDLAIGFIGCQIIVSYFASGLAKSFGSEWTNGTAVERVARTHTYGNRKLYEFLRARPRFSEFLTYSTTSLELVFPVIVRSRIGSVLGLAAMGLFHLANSHFLGLGRFLLAFVAGYPTVLRVVNPRT
ncbi:hypothetical protein [Mycetocola tolaasinivorans]|uniref:hypothetical protein n=1 Tax=Mycetocola tolaasinivorans TaxID=76635 RepID=UPI0011C41ADC|nr:hypothetical protein [Mycetocola tolaasinivorans]